MKLRPFFCFFGGKWRAAPRYPAPQFPLIVEPFAGAAGYATRYAERSVILFDADPVIAGLWQYLIRASSAEIRRIPLLRNDETVDDLGAVAEEAKHLVGFWLNKATAAPCKSPGAWMREGLRPRSFWSETIRERIATQVDHIRHWRAFNRSYAECPNGRATWFIDPPYQRAGTDYRFGSSRLDFALLATWCRIRRGQVMVCENTGADWLPFEPFASIKGTAGARRSGTSKEALYVQEAA
jgi:hypothetical protein